MSLKVIENHGLLTVTRRLTEGYMRPTNRDEAEEAVGMILGDLDSVSSPKKRERLLKLARGYMRLYGLDKDRGWMDQYKMRKNTKPRMEAKSGYCEKYDCPALADHTCDGWVARMAEGKGKAPNYRTADDSKTCGNCKAFKTEGY